MFDFLSLRSRFLVTPFIAIILTLASTIADKHGINISLSCSEGIFVYADHTRLKQVLLTCFPMPSNILEMARVSVLKFFAVTMIV